MTAQAPKPRRRTPLTVCQLEDRTTPTTLGAFGAVPQLGSLVYEATGTGSLGSVVASDGFESGSLGPAWSTYSSSADGRIQVTGAFGTASGADALLMDTQASAVYNLNEAVWHVQAPGAAAPVLRFSHASYNDEIDALGTAPYTGHHTGDGVSVSNDGVTWYPVWTPQPPEAPGVWAQHSVDPAAAVHAAGGTLTAANFYVKFQQYDNFPLTTDGRGYDDIAVIGPGAPDVTTFTVDPGQTVTVIVDGSDRLQPTARLKAGTTTVGAATAAAPGGEATIQTVHVPGYLAGGSTGPQTYTLEVGGTNGNLGGFSVRVVLNAGLEAENLGGPRNDTPAGAQSLDPTFVQLHRDGTADPSGRQPQRAAVLGVTDGSPFGGELNEREVNDPGPFTLPRPVDFAQNLDGAGWNLGADPDVTDSTTLPHISVEGTGNGTFDYYKFTVPAAGARGVFDIDNESSLFFGLLDTMIFLFDDAGNELDESDDSFPDPGSNSSLASFIDHTFDAPGTYVIVVAEFYSFASGGGLVDGTPLFDGDAYTLQVSVAGHALNPGGSDPVAEVEPNDPAAVPPPNYASFAQNIDAANWVVNADPNFVNPQTLPHLTVHGTGDGTFDYYSFTVPAAGGTVSLGLDAASASWGAQGFLLDSSGQVFAAFAGSGPATLNVPGGTYTVGVGTFGTAVISGNLFGGEPQTGDSYDLRVSVAGHAVVPTSPDLYALPLKGGESAAVTATPLGAGSVRVELLSPAGVVVASGAAGASNVGSAIAPFTAPANGTYYVRLVGATAGTPYDLVVTRNVTIDLEGNGSIATAQPITSPQVAGRRWAMGYAQGGTDLSPLFGLRGTPVTGGLTLAGTNLRLGINADGSFITDDLSAGIEYLGTEFAIPGTPLASFTVSRNGQTFTNSAPAPFGSAIAVTIEDLSTATRRGARIVGTAGGNLQVERVILFDVGAEYATIATRVTNTGGATLSNVAWLENIDPDQGFDLGAGYETANDVVSGGRLVRASAFPAAYPDGLTIGLGSADGRSAFSAEGFFNTDPFEIINSPVDPNGHVDDIAINGAFNFGSLAPGQSASGAMLMTFGRSVAAADALYAARAVSTQAADRDFYRITADARAMLEIDTATPADGTGAFANTFDPIIRLYDAAGNLVASNDNGSADGRNASLKYKVPVGAGGTYYVEVSASPLTAAPTRGEYVLMIKGDSAPAAGHSASAAVAVAAATAAPAVAAAGTVSGGDRPGIWWVDLTAGAVPGGDQLTPTAGPAKGMTAAVRSESAAGVDGGPTPGVTARSLSPLTRLDFAPPDGVGRSDAATVDPLGWGVWLGG